MEISPVRFEIFRAGIPAREAKYVCKCTCSESFVPHLRLNELFFLHGVIEMSKPSADQWYVACEKESQVLGTAASH